MKQTEIGEIPEDWNVVSVDDFIKSKKGAIKIGPFGSQLKKDSFVAEGVKVYGQENIFVNSMSFGDRYITEEHFQRLKSCELFPGDFIISMMGTIGKCMVVPKGIQKGIMDSHLLRLQLNQNVLLPEYLSQLFGSPLVLDQVKKLAVGGIMAGLSSTIVKNIKFILPPLPEQQKIAQILSAVDEKIAVIDEQLAKTTELKTGLMQRLLTKGIGHTEFKDSPLGEIPKTWTTTKLQNVSAFITKGSTPTTYGFKWVDEGIVFLRSECVGTNGFTKSGAMYISEEAHKILNRSEIKSGDLLMTITGYVGRVCVLPPEIKEANINQHIARIRVDSPLVDANFVYQFISQESFIKEHSKIVTGQAYPQLSLKQVREMKIPLPPLSEQRKITELLTTVDEKIQVLRDKKAHYQTLKCGLMQLLPTGKLRVHIGEEAVTV
ncbi:restriction endonuclease subunit S [Larkinella ripae]